MEFFRKLFRRDSTSQSLSSEASELFLRATNSYEAALNAMKPFHDQVATWESEIPSSYKENDLEEHSEAIERLASSLEILTLVFDALRAGQSQAAALYKAAANALEAAANSYHFSASKMLAFSLQEQVNALQAELDSKLSDGSVGSEINSNLKTAESLEKAATTAKERADSIRERAQFLSTYALAIADSKR